MVLNEAADGRSPDCGSRGNVATKVLVVAGTSFNAVTVDALVSAMPEISKQFSAYPNAEFVVQMIMVTPTLSIIVGSPLAGVIANRIGLRALMLPSLIIYALCGLVGYFASGPTELIASRVVLGFVSGLLGACCLSRAAEFEPATGARLLGFANAMAAATAIGSFIIGGWAAREYGWHSANLVYLWTLLLIVFAAVSAPPDQALPQPETHRLKAPFPWRTTAPIYAFTLVIFMVVYGSSIEGPFLLARRGMTDPAQIGVAISASAFNCVLAAAAYGWVNRRIGAGAQYIVIFSFFLASTTGAALATDPIWTTTALGLTGFGSGLLSPLLLSSLMRSVPREDVATATGAFASFTSVCVFLTPPAYHAITSLTPLSVFGGLAVISAIGLAGAISLVATGRLGR